VRVGRRRRRRIRLVLRPVKALLRCLERLFGDERVGQQVEQRALNLAVVLEVAMLEVAVDADADRGGPIRICVGLCIVIDESEARRAALGQKSARRAWAQPPEELLCATAKGVVDVDGLGQRLAEVPLLFAVIIVSEPSRRERARASPELVMSCSDRPSR